MVPFGVIYARKMGRLYRTGAAYAINIDRLLMYLARYGRQPATEAQHQPTVTLLSWADRVHEFLQEESRQAEAARRR